MYINITWQDDMESLQSGVNYLIDAWSKKNNCKFIEATFLWLEAADEPKRTLRISLVNKYTNA